ncbi:MAG TPA: hypothetical protein VFQ45_03680 [Longimicrobium sp.]|nr:hypothetical protein [Longimicrobium sp.]
MNALGFGKNVTGGGPSPTRIAVTQAANTGSGSLANAIGLANANSRADASLHQEIVIGSPGSALTVKANDTNLVVTARNLTIRAIGGAVIRRNHLVFDCASADNIILRDLSFDSDGTSDPEDCITIDGRVGRQPTGFWIDHCSFEAFRDMCITSYTRDLPGQAPPLLISISSCRFNDRNPSGTASFNHGAVGIYGATKHFPDDTRTNTYATIYGNYFRHTRRRSPRSTQLTLVHAFNNVLDEWGSTIATELQQNGMASGNFGLLVAVANYFQAGRLKEAIEVAGGKKPARLSVPARGARVNQYRNDAIPAVLVGQRIALLRQYASGLGTGTVPPRGDPMTDALAQTIRNTAGARVTAA